MLTTGSFSPVRPSVRRIMVRDSSAIAGVLIAVPRAQPDTPAAVDLRNNLLFICMRLPVGLRCYTS
jgi:hypothetical protein